ncbi:MAG: hypothetical protein ACP5RZ_04110 [Thermoplasmata archaeon]
MEELLCSIEFYQDKKKFVARIKSELGGLRELKNNNFDDLLSDVMMELNEEFENLTEM